jgi:hypothetical protein
VLPDFLLPTSGITLLLPCFPSFLRRRVNSITRVLPYRSPATESLPGPCPTLPSLRFGFDLLHRTHTSFFRCCACMHAASPIGCLILLTPWPSCLYFVPAGHTCQRSPCSTRFPLPWTLAFCTAPRIIVICIAIFPGNCANRTQPLPVHHLRLSRPYDFPPLLVRVWHPICFHVHHFDRNFLPDVTQTAHKNFTDDLA